MCASIAFVGEASVVGVAADCFCRNIVSAPPDFALLTTALCFAEEDFATGVLFASDSRKAEVSRNLVAININRGQGVWSENNSAKRDILSVSRLKHSKSLVRL